MDMVQADTAARQLRLLDCYFDAAATVEQRAAASRNEKAAERGIDTAA